MLAETRKEACSGPPASGAGRRRGEGEEALHAVNHDGRPPADAPEPQKPLFPVVGCDGSLSLSLNFGARPFLFQPAAAPDLLRQPRWSWALQQERIRSAFMLDLDEFESGLDSELEEDEDDGDDDDDDE